MDKHGLLFAWKLQLHDRPRTAARREKMLVEMVEEQPAEYLCGYSASAGNDITSTTGQPDSRHTSLE